MLDPERAATIKDWAERYWYAVVITAAIPGIWYFGAAPETREAFRPVFSVERPGEIAVRAEDGPGTGGGLEDDGVRHVVKPGFVKGVYMSSATAGYKKRFDELVAFVDKTEVNALVIDVKEDRGALAFVPRAKALEPYVSPKPSIRDIRAMTAALHEKGIYLIARVFVFQDPYLVSKRPELAVQFKGGGVWKDRKGQTWLDPASKEVWKYNALVAKEVYAAGFDEIQFDYIRFLSDGQTSLAAFPAYDGITPKEDVIKDFFSYMDTELRVKSGIPISADLFGLTMWQHDYDLNIGQRLEHALRHFDAVSPMVYPSHYPAGFLGFANPAAHPYEIVRKNMDKGNVLLATLDAETEQKKAEGAGIVPSIGRLRPWVQDFDLGAEYTPKMVRDQMRAIEEARGEGWIFWNARNVYTEEAYALEPSGH